MSAYPLPALVASLFVQRTGDLVLAVDRRWRCVFANPAVRSLLGLSDGDTLGVRLTEHLHPGDREVVDHVQRVLDAGAPTTTAMLRVGDGEGRWSWVDVTITTVEHLDAELLDAGGSPTPELAASATAMHWLVVGRDVTDRVRLEQEGRRRAAQQAEVAALGMRALTDEHAASVLALAAPTLARAIGTPYAELLEARAEGVYTVQSVAGWPATRRGQTVLPTPRSLAVLALTNDGPLVVDDLEAEQVQPMVEAPGVVVRSSLAVPLVINGRAAGLLAAHHVDRHPFDEHDVNVAVAIASVVASALERDQTQQRMRHQALHDPATGLPNRALLMDRLEQSLRKVRRDERGAALLFCDLDGFKHINDLLGHDAGDRVLQAVADRLGRCVRPADTVARLGGDEFVLLLDDLQRPEQAVEVAERILEVLADPIDLGVRTVRVTGSIGVSPLGPSHDRPEAVLRDADTAMYRAKEQGRNRVDVFDAGLRARVVARQQVEDGLRLALERNELFVMYQPVVNLVTGRLHSLEALLRWRHPERGPVAPSEFIAVAEQCGLIVPMGLWVLEEATRQVAEWRSGPSPADVSVAVNLSARQLRGPGLVEQVEQALDAAGLPACALTLEITESMLMDDTTSARQLLAAARELGCKVAVDDFGTGYSSLAYLRRLPIDSLKIDRSFVDGLGSDPDDSAIAGLVADMARALGLGVVGEGVETVQQAETLQAIGCDLAQGYLFSRPVAAAEVPALLHGSAFWWQQQPDRIG